MKHFNKWLMIIFILCFSAVGVFLMLHSSAATSTISMVPTKDIDKSTVAGAGDTVNLFNNVNDGKTFAAADDSTSYVRGLASSNMSSHQVGYSGATAGTVSQVVVNYRAQQGTAFGTAQIQLFDGAALIRTGQLHTLGAGYTNYTDTFSGLNVADANNLSTKIIFLRTSGTGALRYTQIWLDVTIGTVTPPPSDPVIGIAGDIACDPVDTSFYGGAGDSKNCHMKSTSDLLVNSSPALTAVLTTGDNAYNGGTLAQYQKSYALSWGRLKAITYPVTGNHEFGSPAASGYFDYFNGVGVTHGRAGDRGKGYYSYDIGNWHFIALSSGNASSSTSTDCGAISCKSGSPQELWLKADLAAHANSCTLAYWHHPRWSTGDHGNNTFMQAIWSDLAAAKADVVLNGHSHDYERFIPLNASGVSDPNGIREFVVGTGGVNEIGFPTPAAATTAARFKAYGILKLTLHSSSYDWQFVHDPTSPFTPLVPDSGSGNCH